MEKQEIIIYNSDDGKVSVSLMAKDGNVWLNQQLLAELFNTSVPNISIHISNIFNDNELNANSVVKDYLTTAADGKNYNVTFYSLDMILAVGFRVRSKRGVQFRKWANTVLKDFMQKGFVMDDERLKNPDGRPDYYDELLERIRDIRASEKRFYQKVRDLFALSSDYDSTDKATQMFFAETQNKLLYAVTGKTATELIVARANANEPNINKIAGMINVHRNQINDYFHYMEKAGLILQLQSSSGGLKALSKAEKIYLNNPNLIYSLASQSTDTGNLRETFFYNQMSVNHAVYASEQSDFTIDNHTFEVGGKNKGKKQIFGLTDAFVVKDDIEFGYQNVLPLWTFGLNY